MTHSRQSQKQESGHSNWKLDLALSLLFLTVALATAPGGGVWAQQPPIPFGAEQTNVAHALAEGRGFADPDPQPTGPTAWVPPLWPGILALIYRCCGVDTALASRIIIALQYLLAAYTLFALLRCLHGRSGWASRLVVMVLFALLAYPLVQMLAASAADDLWIVWALLASLLWLCTAEAWSWSRLLGMSLLGALSVLAHAGVGLAFLVTTGVCLFVNRKHWNSFAAVRRLSLSGRHWVVYLGAVLALGGWGWRNYERFHALIPLKSTLWFEVALTLLPRGHSGVLTLSDMVLRHPSYNSQINAHMAQVGEQTFMAEQRRAVMKALRGQPRVFLRQIWHRAVNALAYAEPIIDADDAHAELPDSDWTQLQAAGLICMSPDDRQKTWVYLGRPVTETMQYIAALPLEQKQTALRDWMRAATAFHESTTSRRAVWTRLLYGSLPTLCLFWGVWRGWRASPALLSYACLAYVAVLLPNILITHNLAHQFRFIPLHIAVVAATLFDLDGLITARFARAPSPQESVPSPCST